MAHHLRNWDRRHRISALIKEALYLSKQESTADPDDRQTIAMTVRLGLLYEDAIELEEKALERRLDHGRDRSSE
jgi:hypothetical protein